MLAQLASLVKHKEHRHDQADEGCQVIPVQRLSVEIDRDKYGEYRQRDDFLNHLQLHDVERSAVAVKADAVGGNLAAVFGQRQQP